jgi:hypothetical protein
MQTGWSCWRSIKKFYSLYIIVAEKAKFLSTIVSTYIESNSTQLVDRWKSQSSSISGPFGTAQLHLQSCFLENNSMSNFMSGGESHVFTASPCA